MKWQRWTAAGLIGVVAIALGMYSNESTRTTGPNNLSSNLQEVRISTPSPAASSSHLPAPKGEEQQLKQMMLVKDINATEQLIRRDAIGHLQSMLKSALSNTDQKNRILKQEAAELQRDHKQFQQIMWYDGPTGKLTTYVHPLFKTKATDSKEINQYVNYAKQAIKKGQPYESPLFPSSDPEYFVTAQPGRNKQGIIAVMDTTIMDKVKDHQNKNLRLIPYPKEGRYQIESIHADTHRDITVKTGHDNEKASHYNDHEIVVTFGQKAPTAEQLKQITAKLQGQPARKIGNTYIFQSKHMNYDQLKQYFNKQWKPQHVEPHYLYLTNENKELNATEIPNDALFSDYQWNLPIIETNRGWKLTKGSNEVIVAVVDTGVDIHHPDLKGKLLKGYNVINPDQDPNDDVGHGTHVAGIISASVNNNEGIAGMMWGGKLLPIKALDNTGSGTTYSVAQGIIWATDHGAKVINLSLGNYADAKFLHEAIKYAYDRDVVIIAATGNDNTERPGYPAAYPEVLSVSATDYNLNRASFSNYGDYIDVMAPGESIASTYPDNQYAALSGTSMASPHVAALAGLIRSINPDLNNTEVMDIIRTNVVDLGDQGRDKYFGYGQIDVYAALQAAGGKTSPLQLWPQTVDQKIQNKVEQAK